MQGERERPSLVVEVTPGPHRVQARIDWSGSRALDVHAARPEPWA